jgi:Ankyrin repeats (many copies)
MATLQIKYGFIARVSNSIKHGGHRLTPVSKPQFVRKLKSWGCRKNTSSNDWKRIARTIQRRQCEGKESIVIINGEQVDNKRLRKELSRYKSAVHRNRGPSDSAKSTSSHYHGIEAALQDTHIDNDIEICTPGPIEAFTEPRMNVLSPCTKSTSVRYATPESEVDTERSTRARSRYQYPDAWTLLQDIGLGKSLPLGPETLEQNDPLQVWDKHAHKLDHSSALQAAIEHRHLEAAAILLAIGAEVNVPSSAQKNLTHLTYAVLMSDVTMVRLLLENGADPNQAFFASDTFDGTDPSKTQICLLAALRKCNDEICAELLDHGANPNARGSSDTETALMMATGHGRHSLMQKLID